MIRIDMLSWKLYRDVKFTKDGNLHSYSLSYSNICVQRWDGKYNTIGKRWMVSCLVGDHLVLGDFWRYGIFINVSKLLMGKPSQSLVADVLRLSRTQIRAVTGLMTGHCNLRKHLHTMGIFKENPVWRLYNEEEENISHIVFECEVGGLISWVSQTQRRKSPWITRWIGY
jgi:hypothetical protein